jgi:type II secretory pathway pseudopilin PulG
MWYFTLIAGDFNYIVIITVLVMAITAAILLVIWYRMKARRSYQQANADDNDLRATAVTNAVLKAAKKLPKGHKIVYDKKETDNGTERKIQVLAIGDETTLSENQELDEETVNCVFEGALAK